MGAVLHLSVCSTDPVSRLFIEKVDERFFMKRNLLLVSPYAKLFSEELEHVVSISTFPLYFEIPSLLLCMLKLLGR